jgi:hypothetical protein
LGERADQRIIAKVADLLNSSIGFSDQGRESADHHLPVGCP